MRGQGLAALPQLHRLLEAGLAPFEPGDEVDELLPRLLVAEVGDVGLLLLFGHGPTLSCRPDPEVTRGYGNHVAPSAGGEARNHGVRVLFYPSSDIRTRE